MVWEKRLRSPPWAILKAIRPTGDVFCLELFKLKIRDFLRPASALSVTVAVLSLVACAYQPYKTLQNNFAGRPNPPSGLRYRVLVSVGNTGIAGTGGQLSILDVLRDIRSSVYDSNALFSIAGYSANNGTRIVTYPEQVKGDIFSYTASGASDITAIDYGAEKTSGSVASFSTKPNDFAISADGAYALGAQESVGSLNVIDRTGSTTGTGASYPLSLPGVYKVAMNPSHTVMLAMVRNSNQLYRVVKLNTTDPPPAGYISCQPQVLPVYCVLPVPGTYDRPFYGYFSPDGSSVYMLNCGPECGGNTASVSVLNLAPLQMTNFDSTTSPVTTNIPLTSGGQVGGATIALSDGNVLYVAGQRAMPDGLFTGTLTSINPVTNTVTAIYSISNGYSISDGTHTKMLFADDNTLWIGSQNCASGERQHNNVNYNCLTRFDRTANTAGIIPNVDPASGGTSTVPHPNENQDPYYYGSLTGLCWVQGFNKVYTAYGGQVHFFFTADGSEGDNYNVTVNGVALDVAYMDATTNAAN